MANALYVLKESVTKVWLNTQGYIPNSAAVKRPIHLYHGALSRFPMWRVFKLKLSNRLGIVIIHKLAIPFLPDYHVSVISSYIILYPHSFMFKTCSNPHEMWLFHQPVAAFEWSKPTLNDELIIHQPITGVAPTDRRCHSRLWKTSRGWRHLFGMPRVRQGQTAKKKGISMGHVPWLC